MAMDEQLSRLRNGAPLKMDVAGRDHLHFRHDDMMLESATTSFQIHLKIDPARSGRFYDAAKIISAPMVALSANLPYLFGADLWDEAYSTVRTGCFGRGYRRYQAGLCTGYGDGVFPGESAAIPGFIAAVDG